MDEFIKIRIEELKVLKENVLQKQREELAKIDVRIDELKNMLSSSSPSFSSEASSPETVNKVASVLKEEPKNLIKKSEIVLEPTEATIDDLGIDLEEESSKVMNMSSDEVDLESMLNSL